jgi:hypothetical protein
VVFYRVLLQIQDADGQVTHLTKDILPHTVDLSLQTNPVGGVIIFDTETFTTPAVLSRTVGMVSSMSVPLSQTIGGANRVFSSWSQGGAASQQITVPASGGTFVANFVAMGSEATATPTPAATTVPVLTLTPQHTATPSQSTTPTNHRLKVWLPIIIGP